MGGAADFIDERQVCDWRQLDWGDLLHGRRHGAIVDQGMGGAADFIDERQVCDWRQLDWRNLFCARCYLSIMGKNSWGAADPVTEWKQRRLSRKSSTIPTNRVSTSTTS